MHTHTPHCTPSSASSASIQINRICVQSDFFRFCRISSVRLATDIVVLQFSLKFTSLITSPTHSDTDINWMKHTKTDLSGSDGRMKSDWIFRWCNRQKTTKCSGCRGKPDRIFVCRSPKTRIIWCVIELVDWKIEMFGMSTLYASIGSGRPVTLVYSPHLTIVVDVNNDKGRLSVVVSRWVWHINTDVLVHCFILCLLHWSVQCSKIGRRRRGDDNVGYLLLCFQLTEGRLIELNVIVSTASSMYCGHTRHGCLVCRRPNAGYNSLF